MRRQSRCDRQKRLITGFILVIGRSADVRRQWDLTVTQKPLSGKTVYGKQNKKFSRPPLDDKITAGKDKMRIGLGALAALTCAKTEPSSKKRSATLPLAHRLPFVRKAAPVTRENYLPPTNRPPATKTAGQRCDATRVFVRTKPAVFPRPEL